MDEQVRTFYELRFRTQFLESKAAMFQDLFVAVMSKAHPGEFIPCRPWGNVGDRKNDGYLKSERTLFQVYAPNEMKVAIAVRKIEADLKKIKGSALDIGQITTNYKNKNLTNKSSGRLPAPLILSLCKKKRRKR